MAKLRKWHHGIVLLSLSALALAVALTWLLPEAVITISWNTAHQTIDGFGASATGYTGAFTPAQADAFFSPATGLGLSLLRLKLIPDTAVSDCGCVANSAPYACVVGSKSQIVAGDLQVARLAAERGATLLATPWSPPATMKSSGSYCTSGSFLGSSTNYATYAADLASFPSLLSRYGLSLYAMSIQNEPDTANGAYDTCRWTAQQVHDFIPYLSNALGAAGLGAVKIAVPEESHWTFGLIDASMADPAVASHIGVILGHAYGVNHPSGLPMANGRRVWQTEVSGFDRYDGTMDDALTWARRIHNYLNVGVSAWLYWNVDCGAKYYNARNNMCLTDQSGTLAKRAYVLGQYAKFIRPGWQRIDVLNSGPLLVTAYRGPEREFVIVAVNSHKRSFRNQRFVLTGATSQRSGVTPWLTSTNASLTPQPPLCFTSNGKTLIYTIPATSVVTLQGRAD